MKLIKKHILYFICAGILFELFFGLGLCVTDNINFIHKVDADVMGWFVDMRTNDWNSLMTHVTRLGGYGFVLNVTVIVGLLMAVFGHIEIALGIMVALVSTSYVTSFMKKSFHILRPDNYVYHVGGWSYPSGHTSASAILAIMIIWAAVTAIPHKITRYTIISIAGLYALAVAVSRMYLGAHWLSDVIGGVLLAASIGLLVMGLLKPVIMKRKEVSN